MQGFQRIAPWIAVACLLAGPAFAQSPNATATGVSRDFNPAISVNTLFLGTGFSGLDATTREGSEELRGGVRHQESEIQFTSTIDPYTSANIIFAFEDGSVELEEGYVTTNVIPGGIGLRAGQMFVGVGRENTLHTHQLPFVQRSLVGGALFGEALSEFGAEVTYVAPLAWFLEFQVAAFNGDAEGLFDAPGDADLAYLSGFTALWDIGDSATLTVQGDYLGGPNAAGDAQRAQWSHVWAGVMRYKWKSARPGRNLGVDVVAEYLYGERNAADVDATYLERGAYAYADVRVSRRWHVQGRHDALLDDGSRGDIGRTSLALAFVPTEFSSLRAQASHVDTQSDDYLEFLLQYNFTIGSHPAHQY